MTVASEHPVLYYIGLTDIDMRDPKITLVKVRSYNDESAVDLSNNRFRRFSRFSEYHTTEVEARGALEEALTQRRDKLKEQLAQLDYVIEVLRSGEREA